MFLLHAVKRLHLYFAIVKEIVSRETLGLVGKLGPEAWERISWSGEEEEGGCWRKEYYSICPWALAG